MPSDYDSPRNRSRDRDDRGDDDDRPRRRRNRDRDGDDDDDRPRRRRYEDSDGAPKEPSNGLATAGLILGVLSLCTGPLAGIPALICAGMALSRPGGRGAAGTGLALGGIGTLITPVILVALLLPAVANVRTAAARMSDQNNMKIAGLAFHNQAAVNGGFTAPYAQDEFGKVQTGLSFRVGLLPYIEQHNLYRQFDLTQSWDSARNQASSNARIKTYTTPFDGPEPSANTPYRVFYGGGALFEEDGQPVDLARIPDGTSNTILVVHAFEQVPWAEPREFRYSDNAPLPKFGHSAVARGFNVLMADGSVRFVSDKASEQTIRWAITKNDGHVLPDNW